MLPLASQVKEKEAKEKGTRDKATSKAGSQPPKSSVPTADDPPSPGHEPLETADACHDIDAPVVAAAAADVAPASAPAAAAAAAEDTSAAIPAAAAPTAIPATTAATADRVDDGTPGEGLRARRPPTSSVALGGPPAAPFRDFSVKKREGPAWRREHTHMALLVTGSLLFASTRALPAP